MLDSALPAQRWYRQRRYLGSALWSEEGGEAFESWSADEDGAADGSAPSAMYYVVIAAHDEAALPPSGPGLSLFRDRGDREWLRIEDQAREVLRLDGLLKDRDAALDRQGAHIRHLEELIAYRDRIVAERDAQLAAAHEAAEAELARANRALANEAEQARNAGAAVAALETERTRLERAIAAQERIIAYRQSARWWFRLPWVRVRLVWRRLAGE